MKILNKPIDISNWAYKHTCGGCDCDLEVELTDIKHRYFDGDFREPGYDKFWANCVVCYREFIIGANHIPKLVQVEIKKRMD